ncbi:MAG: beta-N-acetylhexosaminidase [Alphaproteobacteria bacterium]|nr:beta-N-acetylhexosaminidase [Alphaproteobacteria bacterium]
MSLSRAIFGCSGLRLTAEEKAFFRAVKPYGFILFARNCAAPDQVRALVADLHEASGRPTLPILIDQEGGRVARLKPPHWPAYPPAGSLAALYARDPQAAKHAVYLNARLMAEDLAALGITVDCAPLADLPVEGAHDIIGDRAFGRSPQQVIDLARAMADGLIDSGVVPVLKHIPGHGRARADSHEELPVVDSALELLRETDFVPFKALSDLPMAMTAHVVFTALDPDNMATTSVRVNDLIRGELGFAGLLMSDDLSMKAMKGGFAERTNAALSAGCDVVLHCNGDMAEMTQIAQALLPLEGMSLLRGERAMARVGARKAFDVEAARDKMREFMAA